MRKGTLIQSAIWEPGSDLREIPWPARYVYMMLLTQPTVTGIGLLHLSRRRWAALAFDGDTELLDTNLALLEEREFVWIDEATEELIIRSWCKHNVEGNPQRQTAARRLRGEVASTDLHAKLTEEYPWLSSYTASHAASNGASPTATRPPLGGIPTPPDDTASDTATDATTDAAGDAATRPHSDSGGPRSKVIGTRSSALGEEHPLTPTSGGQEENQDQEQEQKNSRAAGTNPRAHGTNRRATEATTTYRSQLQSFIASLHSRWLFESQEEGITIANPLLHDRCRARHPDLGAELLPQGDASTDEPDWARARAWVAEAEPSAQWLARQGAGS